MYCDGVQLTSTQQSDYGAGELTVEELVENVKEVEKAVHEKMADIGENGPSDDSVLDLAKDLAHVREMEDSLLQVLANTETEEEEDDSEVIMMSQMAHYSVC